MRRGAWGPGGLVSGEWKLVKVVVSSKLVVKIKNLNKKIKNLNKKIKNLNKKIKNL
jgi:uncharacterized protein YlxW (UPF0749 family)